MKKLTITSLFLILSTFTFAQKEAPKPYFQQEVNYKIKVSLDDEKHILTGNIEIEYINNSPDDLTEIYFHLWPNAYKNPQTAFAKQKYEDNSTRFLFADEADRGYIDSLNFTVDGQSLIWEYDKEHIDIALVKLNQPIKSGTKAIIKTPFKVKVPKSFSRLGHVKTSYQMTQWYPKPAVYDQFGWHPMPYLDQGEFYSEYGSFDVSITLPMNYVVGATGILQNEEEHAFLEERAEETTAKIDDNSIIEKQDYPESATETKTIQYKAENVHDFAWFADKRFYVQKDNVTLPSGKKVDTYVMFTAYEADLWKEAILYVNRSVEFYSDRIGEYPYPHATAVQSALSAGAGMEYPMITVIGGSGNGKSLDQVITHEVGHNWFYGILGSNERQFVWMDEGFNSFYEQAYIKKYYETENTLGDLIPPPVNRVFGKDELNQDIGYIVYALQEKRGEMVNMSSNSGRMTQMNYGSLGYMYPAYLFRYAEAYLGEELYDKTMHAYFDKWKFKHPYPQNTKNVFEKETNKDFDWLFDDLFGSRKKLDYALTNLNKSDGKITLKVTNKGQVAGPFSISGMRNGVALETVWYDGFFGTKDLEFPKEYDGYRIDALNVMPESNRYNNYIKNEGAFKKADKLQLKLLGGLETGEKRTLYLMPMVLFNSHDGLMLGGAFYNGFIPQKSFEFSVVPMYGFGSDQLVGTTTLDYYMFPKSDNFRHVRAGLNVKSFSRSDNSAQEYSEQYLRVQPRLELKFKPEARSTVSSYLRARGAYIQEGFAQFDTIGNFSGIDNGNRMMYELGYELENDRPTYPYNLKISLTGNNYSKAEIAQSNVLLSVEGNYLFNYYKKRNKGIRVRAFAGQFLTNTDTDFGAFPMSITAQGMTDYFYDKWYFGRGDRDGLMARQLYENTQGGFKTPLDAAYRGVGKSNSTMITTNFTFDAPMNFLPMSAFVDFAYFEDTRPSVNEFKLFYSAGLKLSLLDGQFNIYAPLWGTDELMNAFNDRPNFFQRLSFSINIKTGNPIELLRKQF